ncbi:MAG TPA: hypothetical protein VLQ48_15855, partial [Chloroflexia bacterium]|nr:hypothetical protein [Chloroflexia bacterium]
ANKRETTLDINGGGNRIIVNSVSGDISIRPRKVPEVDRPNSETVGAGTTDLSRAQSSQDDNHGDMSKPEGYVTRQQAELDILQKVGTGELSPQEALRALSNLAGES